MAAADFFAVSQKTFEKRCKAWGRHHYSTDAEFDFDVSINDTYTFYICTVWLHGNYVAALELGPIGFQVLFSKGHRSDEP